MAPTRTGDNHVVASTGQAAVIAPPASTTSTAVTIHVRVLKLSLMVCRAVVMAAPDMGVPSEPMPNGPIQMLVPKAMNTIR